MSMGFFLGGTFYEIAWIDTAKVFAGGGFG
jgi:hypothetical protein